MRRILSKLKIILTMLLMAVVVVLPVLESAACSLETATHQTGTFVGPAETPHEQGDSQHAPCVHSHCHHSSATVLPDLSVDQGINSRQQSVLMGEFALQPSAPIDGLMRPPRT